MPKQTMPFTPASAQLSTMPRMLSSTQTRIAVEDYIAELTAEYYNFVQQRQRLSNYVSAVKLSR